MHWIILPVQSSILFQISHESITMKSLGLVTCACVMVAGMGMVMTQTPEELCTLASHNISMMSKDRIPYFMKPNVDTRLYVSLCHPLGDLSSSGVIDLCDKTAFACITKMRGECALYRSSVCEIYLINQSFRWKGGRICQKCRQ